MIRLMNNRSYSIPNPQFIIGFLFVLILCQCTNTTKESNKPNESHSIAENCVKILHPVWVEESTYIEVLYANKKIYKGAVLKGFLKNMCLDTIVVHLNNTGLHVGVVDYFLKYDNGYFGTIDDLTKSKVKLAPSDSVYLDISQSNLLEVDDIDSIRLVAYIDSSNGDDLGIIKIYKEDFYTRSLLFSEYYRLIIDDHRKKIRTE